MLNRILKIIISNKAARKILVKSLNKIPIQNFIAAVTQIVLRKMTFQNKYLIEDFLLKDWYDFITYPVMGSHVLQTHNFAKILGSPKLISFIIINYGKQNSLLKCLNSIYSQESYDTNSNAIEIIVIEDGDTTLMLENIPKNIIYLNRNRFQKGMSRSRNLGAKVSSGKFLVFLDSDIVLESKYLVNLIKIVSSSDETTVISGYIKNYWENIEEDPRTLFGVWENANRVTKRFYHTASGNLVVPRSIFFSIGGFDEDLIYGWGEDTVFGFKLSELKLTNVYYSNELVVNHNFKTKSQAHSETDQDRNMLIIAAKYPKLYSEYFKKGLR